MSIKYIIWIKTRAVSCDTACDSITFYSGLVAIFSTTIFKLLFIKLMIKKINTRSYTLKKILKLKHRATQNTVYILFWSKMSNFTSKNI